MSGLAVGVSWGIALVCAASVMGVMLRRASRRWQRNMNDAVVPDYAQMLAALSANSLRHRFEPYSDIDWNAPQFEIVDDDPRWILGAADPVGRHCWYREQPRGTQIAIGKWRQANLAKASSHLESILVRGLMQYTFWIPNGSPEYRYCLSEAIEECNHSLMFQEVVNRIGADVAGIPRWLRWFSQLLPLSAGPLPNVFFFGVLAGEEPIDHMQRDMLRAETRPHPLIAHVAAVHIAEEARHISFAHEYLRRRVPLLRASRRFVLSLYVPLIMRVLAQAILVPPRSFFRTFGVPRSVRRTMFFRSAESQLALRAMFGDVRMLCEELGMLNPSARLMWRLCGIQGRSSRYRSEPYREGLVAPQRAIAPAAPKPVVAPPAPRPPASHARSAR